MSTWHQQILAEFIDFCNAHGSRIFISRSLPKNALACCSPFGQKTKMSPQKFASNFSL